jgi:hypothetical protein
MTNSAAARLASCSGLWRSNIRTNPAESAGIPLLRAASASRSPEDHESF